MLLALLFGGMCGNQVPVCGACYHYIPVFMLHWLSGCDYDIMLPITHFLSFFLFWFLFAIVLLVFGIFLMQWLCCQTWPIEKFYCKSVDHFLFIDLFWKHDCNFSFLKLRQGGFFFLLLLLFFSLFHWTLCYSIL